MVYILLYIIYTIKNEICQLFEQNFLQIFEGVIKIMKKEILITKEMLLVWNVRNVEEKNIAKMGL